MRPARPRPLLETPAYPDLAGNEKLRVCFCRQLSSAFSANCSFLLVPIADLCYAVIAAFGVKIIKMCDCILP